MESTGPAPVYQDFEPSMVWVPEDDADTLRVYLPGFANKEQLRVQLRARNMTISGERKLQQNTWSRFRVEFPVSVNCDLNKISANFEGNILFVRQPKLITPTPKPQVEKPAAVVAPVLPTPQKPMESTGPAPVYQDFEPSMVWVPEDDADTLRIYLPGFANKEQLRVQLRARNMIISGERKLQQNTWSRFRVEFPVSVNCDLNKISANFEGNILFVRQPKLITPTPKPQVEKPAAVVAPVLPTPQKPMDASNAVQKTLPKTKPNIENKEERKDQAEVPKMMGLEQKRGKDTESKTAEGVNENAPDKKTSDWDDKNKKAIMDASNEVQKTLPETKPNIENKEERKDQAEVPKMMGLEEKRGKDTESKTAEGVNENAPDKKTCDWDDKNKKVIMDASNDVQKTLPKTKPNIENKEERKDQAEVPKMMGLEQKRGKDTESKTAEGVNENAPDKKTSDWDDKNKKAIMDASNEVQKTLPETKPNIENKEERKVQAEVPKMMGLEEKRGKDTESKTAKGVNENAPDKKTSDWDDKNKKAIMDASNEVQKTLPEIKPNIENKEERKDQAEVPKMMGPEEKRGKDTESKTAEGVNENAPDKKTSDWDDKNKKAMYSELDKTTKTAFDNYKCAVGVFATKLKTSRNAVNMIVILLVGLVIGMYVSNSIHSNRGPKLEHTCN